jgi:hypothetical protein
MADEKDKALNDALMAYFKALGKVKELHAGTDILLGKLPGTVAPDALGNLSGLTTEELLALIKSLGEIDARNAQKDAQKKAAETNQVNEAAANEWFREHWKDRACPICKQVSWAMAPDFAHIPVARIRVGQVGGSYVRSLPTVALTCRVCGNTLFFNALIMGQLPEGSEQGRG